MSFDHTSSRAVLERKLHEKFGTRNCDHGTPLNYTVSTFASCD